MLVGFVGMQGGRLGHLSVSVMLRGVGQKELGVGSVAVAKCLKTEASDYFIHVLKARLEINKSFPPYFGLKSRLIV